MQQASSVSLAKAGFQRWLCAATSRLYRQSITCQHCRLTDAKLCDEDAQGLYVQPWHDGVQRDLWRHSVD